MAVIKTYIYVMYQLNDRSPRYASNILCNTQFYKRRSTSEYSFRRQRQVFRVLLINICVFAIGFELRALYAYFNLGNAAALQYRNNVASSATQNKTHLQSTFVHE
jgi:hypothetical protein